LLGIRRFLDWIEFDPVLPQGLDGIICERIEQGRTIRYRFAVRSDTPGVKRLSVNKVPLAWIRAGHPFRPGPARVARAAFDALIKRDTTTVEIEV
jgi:hypothetical protein